MSKEKRTVKKKSKHQSADQTKETEEKNQELDACQTELQEWKEKFIRVSADLENFSRRMEKDRARWMQLSQAKLIKDLLSVVDDFQRVSAQQEQAEFSADMKEWLSGFSLIGKSLHKILHSYGLKEIDQTKTFDPTLHEAVAQTESPDHESGEIIEVLQTGYFFGDDVLRPAKVRVAK